MDKAQTAPLKLKVTEAIGKDVGRALARIGPEDLAAAPAEVSPKL